MDSCLSELLIKFVLLEPLHAQLAADNGSACAADTVPTVEHQLCLHWMTFLLLSSKCHHPLRAQEPHKTLTRILTTPCSPACNKGGCTVFSRAWIM